jgi:aminopeptidase N
MKLVMVLALIALLFISGCQPSAPALAGEPGIGDPYYPDLGNGGYDVQKYTLALNIDPASNSLGATATIEARATETLSSFDLDFVGLDIDSITVDDAPADFARSEHELTIMPQKPLKAGAGFTVVIAYHGSPEGHASITSLQMAPEVGWSHAANGAINVMSEPNGASGWYPVNDHPLDKALYRFEVTVPRPWGVAATGSLVEQADVENGTTYTWVMDQPMASYLASINVDRYTVRELDGPHGIHIRSYFPADYPQDLSAKFDKLPEMIAFLETLFGPYPFKEYGVIIADSGASLCDPGTAVETQTLSVHCPRNSMAGEDVIIHELAHQWFGDSVSIKDWKDIWLKEGMATYTEWLWVMRDSGNEGLNRMADSRMFKHALDSPIAEPPAADLYRAESYQGGALVFHALRLRLGDETFFRVIRAYLEKYRDGNAGTEDFIALAQEVSGQNLKSFFDAWLYNMRLPALEN